MLFYLYLESEMYALQSGTHFRLIINPAHFHLRRMAVLLVALCRALAAQNQVALTQANLLPRMPNQEL